MRDDWTRTPGWIAVVLAGGCGDLEEPQIGESQAAISAEVPGAVEITARFSGRRTVRFTPASGGHSVRFGTTWPSHSAHAGKYNLDRLWIETTD